MLLPEKLEPNKIRGSQTKKSGDFKKCRKRCGTDLNCSGVYPSTVWGKGVQTLARASVLSAEMHPAVQPNGGFLKNF